MSSAVAVATALLTLLAGRAAAPDGLIALKGDVLHIYGSPGEELEGRFTLKNHSSDTLALRVAWTTCACNDYSLGSSTLAPGQSTNLVVKQRVSLRGIDTQTYGVIAKSDSGSFTNKLTMVTHPSGDSYLVVQQAATPARHDARVDIEVDLSYASRSARGEPTTDLSVFVNGKRRMAKIEVLDSTHRGKGAFAGTIRMGIDTTGIGDLRAAELRCPGTLAWSLEVGGS